MKKVSPIVFFFTTFMIVVGLLVFIFQNQQETEKKSSQKTLRVMTYSSFLKEWGPGPVLAKEFEEETQIKIEWVEVSNAGLILERLQKQKTAVDVVLGLDLLAVHEAQKTFEWKKLNRSQTYFSRDLPSSIVFENFLPMDWSPLTFVYKKKMEVPRQLDDLLKPEYANSLALQDPNTSATGFYFLTWVLAIKGKESGFEYLKSLKNSIRVVSPSWSASYSLFQNDLAPMVFTFFTSPIYHHLNEKDFRYQPVYFDEPYMYTVEYMAIPETCNQCEEAHLWLDFLLRMSSQRVIMEKNFMLPAVEGVRQRTAFDFPKNIQLIKPNHYLKIIENKNDLLEQWNRMGF
jgi:thiamine transport system substrate-binding protein